MIQAVLLIFVFFIKNCKELKIKYLFIPAILLLLIFTKCAKVSSPTGGPKDSIPPQLISSSPENYSTNIKEQSIEITFDEFIQLKDVNNTLIVSPPLEEKPLVKLKSKTVSIELNNELKDSTTYTLNFGNAIVDNNEGNPKENFEFVFSTGDFVDSFSIGGTLLNSFTLEPPENQIFVSLYKNLSDTAPLTQIPYYISRTDKDGNYSINNIAGGKYRLFAIEDANNNLFYDLPNEKIAFFDSIITIDTSFFSNIEVMKDSIFTDSLDINNEYGNIQNDTIPGNDSVYFKKKYAFHAPLFLFQESFPSQYVKDNNRTDKHRIQIILNEPYLDSVLFSILDSPDNKIELISSFSKNGDTLNFWLPDTVSARKDSIKAEFSFYATDSVFNYYWKTDTLDFNFREPQRVQDRRGKKEEKKTQKAKENINLEASPGSSKTFDLNKKIVINTTYPINSIVVDSIKLYSIEDSIKKQENFQVNYHPYDLSKFSIVPQWKPLTQYELTVIPGAINNIYGYEYDSLRLSMKTREKEHYGSLILNIKGYNNPLIIQLMNEDKSKILDERYCANDTTLLFDYLQPETYQLKMIHDTDSNKVWTTGNYNINRQPEKVEFYPKTLNIRSNWEIEENWNALDKQKNELKIEQQSEVREKINTSRIR